LPNPSEKYARQIGSFPQVEMKTKKKELPPPRIVQFNELFSWCSFDQNWAVANHSFGVPMYLSIEQTTTSTTHHDPPN